MQYKVQIHNYVQNHKDEIVETLKEIIKIPSVRSEVEENAPFGKEWTGRGDAYNYPVDDFLAAAIWEGKSFWDIEGEIEWVDD